MRLCVKFSQAIVVLALLLSTHSGPDDEENDSEQCLRAAAQGSA